MNNRTSIQIEKDTLEELKKFKIVKGETYDELIKRLLNERRNK